jgi:hypothetical protein
MLVLIPLGKILKSCVAQPLQLVLCFMITYSLFCEEEDFQIMRSSAVQVVSAGTLLHEN